MNHNYLFLIFSLCFGMPSINLAQNFSDVKMIIHPVSKNVSYIEGRGGNIGVIHGEDGVLLIEKEIRCKINNFQFFVPII